MATSIVIEMPTPIVIEIPTTMSEESSTATADEESSIGSSIWTSSSGPSSRPTSPSPLPQKRKWLTSCPKVARPSLLLLGFIIAVLVLTLFVVLILNHGKVSSAPITHPPGNAVTPDIPFLDRREALKKPSRERCAKIPSMKHRLAKAQIEHAHNETKHMLRRRELVPWNCPVEKKTTEPVLVRLRRSIRRTLKFRKPNDDDDDDDDQDDEDEDPDLELVPWNCPVKKKTKKTVLGHLRPFIPRALKIRKADDDEEEDPELEQLISEIEEMRGSLKFQQEEINALIDICKNLEDEGIFDTSVYQGPRCGIPPLTLQTWAESNATRLIFREIQALDGRGGFAKHMFQKYAPLAADSMMHCDGHDFCSIGSCMNLNPELDNNTRIAAYYDLEAIAQFAYIQRMTYEATTVASSRFGGLQQQWVDRFTENSARVAMNKKQVFETRQIMHTILASLLIYSAPGQHFLKDWIGWFGGGYAGITSVIGDHIGEMDNTQVLAMDFAELFARGVIKTEGFYDMLSKSLLDGKKVNNFTLANALFDGRYAVSGKAFNFEEAVNHFVGVYFAPIINHAWRMQWTYIVDADPEDDTGCDGDRRGPPWLKMCLPELPNRVFYLYTLSEEISTGSHRKSRMRAARGARNLPGALTLEDVVRSSIAHYDDHGFTELSDIPDFAAEYYKPGSAVAKYGGKYGGLFNLAVARCPGGECISPVNTKKQNFPCMVGPFTWTEGYSRELDLTQQFLNYSGLYASEAYARHCDHGHGCKEHHSDRHWRFPVRGEWGYRGHQAVGNQPFYRCEKYTYGEWGNEYWMVPQGRNLHAADAVKGPYDFPTNGQVDD
ncbi:hypothetical protein EJ06DRAFT_554696 [Trichodelitschia bisporula]|uniref:Uncharacterized protein n=1 Tax=Trichodelitschia bisporula TaxID=703511 RepID=A0A6G1I545_9PEZI|nr:hypothetical protein EJ06DRAFT_554696 [Trichodelitschia bisporula]